MQLRGSAQRRGSARRRAWRGLAQRLGRSLILVAQRGSAVGALWSFSISISLEVGVLGHGGSMAACCGGAVPPGFLSRRGISVHRGVAARGVQQRGAS